MAKVALNYLPLPGFEVAAGTEVSMDCTGPGWFDGRESMRLGGDGIIVSGPDSRILGPALPLDLAVFADVGWTTATWSGYAEAKVNGGKLPTLLVSGSVDKNTKSRWLFSPRTALIQSLSGGQTLKGIVQRSMHRNESGELFIEERNGTTPSHESLLSYELIYQARPRPSLSTVFAGYYNDADIISWDPNVDRTVPVGRLKLAGVESEIAWTGSAGRLWANFSILQMVGWERAAGVVSSGISYSSYDLPLRSSPAVQKGYGEDLNNWPNQALKVFGNFAVSERLGLHADAQFFWDYQGARDGFAAQYRPILGLTQSLFVLNLLGTVGNHRMAYDEGNSRPSPHRARFIREDQAAGFSIGYAL